MAGLIRRESRSGNFVFYAGGSPTIAAAIAVRSSNDHQSGGGQGTSRCWELALAVMADAGCLVPDVPTLKERGIDGTWGMAGLVVRAGTPWMW